MQALFIERTHRPPQNEASSILTLLIAVRWDRSPITYRLLQLKRYCTATGLALLRALAAYAWILEGPITVRFHSSMEADVERSGHVESPVSTPNSVCAESAKAADILIVEDEGVVALDLRISLRRMGHNVIGTADSGQAAIQLAIARQPDIILMDIRLKGSIDGIEATHAIQGTRAIPVIYLTGQLDDATVRRAQATHPAGYLPKPFTTVELDQLIRHVLDQDLAR